MAADAELDAQDVLWDLERLERARGLTAWMFGQFEDDVAGRVLEVGAGIGTFSRLLLERPVSEVVLMEPHPACVETLRRKFGVRSDVTVTDEALPDSPLLAAARGTLDFVLCQNVLEHIEDDAAAMAAIADGLKPGGRLGLLVPAHPALFGSLDRAYGHFRRYTRSRLRTVVEGSGLEIEEIYSFNALGIPGWWVQGRLRDPQLSDRALAVYELLLRVWRPVEDRFRPPAGLSLIVRARKRG
jgi:SAM-dependent methyltransferase